MTQPRFRVSRTFATLIFTVLALVGAVAALSQVLTLAWFVRSELEFDLGSRRAQWGEGLLIGAVTIEVICVAAWRLVTLARRQSLAGATARRSVKMLVSAAAVASLTAIWMAIMLATWPRPNTTFILLFAGAAVVAAGAALLAVVLGRMLAHAVDRDAAATRLQAELDAVI